MSTRYSLNLYSTAYDGGPTSSDCVFGCGMIFKLTPTVSGAWIETVLHQFTDNGKDGYSPQSGLVMDAGGNFYGTTQHGGTHGGGTVYELSPKVGGGWTKTNLVNFGQPAYPTAPLILDDSGNLYGTTPNGGAYSKGRVFEVSPRVGGGWTEATLYSMHGGLADGQQPYGAVVLDSVGNIYATASEGGSYDNGIVFELSPNGSGGWTETIIHEFTGGTDGGTPTSQLIFDSEGNLYGTAATGGTYGGGTVFEMSPEGGGLWTLTTLHALGASGDGSYPNGGVVTDAEGNLYGTTVDGGAGGWGVVFEVTP